MNKVIVRVFGGIGNQLFCYAAARRLALMNNAELVIDVVSGFAYDHTYQQHYQLDHFNIPCRKATAAELLKPFSRFRREILREISLRRPFIKRRYIQQEGMDFDSRLLQIKPRGTVYLEGYWQSEGYFKDVEEAIREDMRIKPPIDAVNKETASRIRDSLAVAVHVRFFDAPNETGSNNAPDAYYASAVKRMEAMVSGAHYFLFSDRPDAARARFPLPDDRITCVTNNIGYANAYADLWLMTLCKHFIIANSTFSWWGAWLASYVNKQVIAPGFEKREGKMWWGINGMIPDDWIRL